jgi:hypothetical protein
MFRQPLRVGQSFPRRHPVLKEAECLLPFLLRAI